MITIIDVAKEAKVSVRTASRAITSSGPVAAKTKTAVLEAVEKLGFVANHSARSLRSGKSDEVVVLVSSLDEMHMSKLAGLEESLRSASFRVQVDFSPLREKSETLYLASVMQRRPAGLVFFSEGNSWNDRLHRACLKLEVPHLFLDADPKLPGIWINRQSGIEESLRYLYETGSRKIAYLGSLEHSANRLPAYLNVIHEKKLKLRYLDFVYETQNAPRQIGRSWPAMKDPPDAIQAFSDRVAMEFLAGLQDKGLVVPKTVRLVGFDDRPMAQLTSPPLTTVRQPNQEMGKLAAEMLLKMIAGQGTSSFGIATKLIIREST